MHARHDDGRLFCWGQLGNVRDRAECFEEREPTNTCGELNPLTGERTDVDRKVEDIETGNLGNVRGVYVGNVEDVKRVDCYPARNLQDELGRVLDPDNYAYGSLEGDFGDDSGISFAYPRESRMNTGRRRPEEER